VKQPINWLPIGLWVIFAVSIGAVPGGYPDKLLQSEPDRNVRLSLARLTFTTAFESREILLSPSERSWLRQ